jgi:hypothetical protein
MVTEEPRFVEAASGNAIGWVLPDGGAATTVTCCMQVAWLPASSAAVQVTVVVPTGKLAGASFVTVGVASTRSETVGAPRFTA